MEGTTINVPELDVEELASLLFDAGQESGRGSIAAVEILLGTGGQLFAREDFRAAYIYELDRPGDACVVAISVPWDRLLQLPMSRGERAMVQIAASIAEAVIEVPLGEMLSRLDRANSRIVLDALAGLVGVR